MNIEILFDDSFIVVCKKPSGICAQEGSNINMVSLLKEQLSCDIFPVHRLDNQTQGIMVFAKQREAAAKLSTQIQNGSFKKKYIAYAIGEFENESGILEDLLFYDRNKNKSFVVKRERKGVKKASLHYKVLEYVNGITKLEIELFTGRTHQIRVQLASRQHPLAGDAKYGGKSEIYGNNFNLTAFFVSFFHPDTKKPMEFQI